MVVELEANNGQIIVVGAGMSVAMTYEILEGSAPIGEEAMVSDGTMQAIITAVNQGRDIGEVLEEVAAGLEVGGSSVEEGGGDEAFTVLRNVLPPVEGNTYNPPVFEAPAGGGEPFSLPVAPPTVVGDTTGPTNVSGFLPETLVDDTGASQVDNLTKILRQH